MRWCEPVTIKTALPWTGDPSEDILVVQPWPKLSHHEQMYNYLLIVLRQVQISPIFFPPPGTNISGRMGIKSRKSSQRQSELSQKFTKDGKCHNFLSQNFDQWQKISPLANNVNDCDGDQVRDQADGMDRRYDNRRENLSPSWRHPLPEVPDVP